MGLLVFFWLPSAMEHFNKTEHSFHTSFSTGKSFYNLSAHSSLRCFLFLFGFIFPGTRKQKTLDRVALNRPRPCPEQVLLGGSLPCILLGGPPPPYLPLRPLAFARLCGHRFSCGVGGLDLFSLWAPFGPIPTETSAPPGIVGSGFMWVSSNQAQCRKPTLGA